MNNLEKAQKIADRIDKGENVSAKEAGTMLDHFGCVTSEEKAAGKRIPDFIDPVVAQKLNDKFRETNGYDHENFINNELGIINAMLEDKQGTQEELKNIREIGAGIIKKGLLELNENKVPVPLTTEQLKKLAEPKRFTGKDYGVETER